MLPSVYIETTIVSYLVARPSRDLIMAERQRQTREWWDDRRREYSLWASELVRDEAAVGEAEMARTRLATLQSLTFIHERPEVETLTGTLISRGVLPPKARADALHISIATVHRLDYLLTWNCKHIANPLIFEAIRRICRERGFEPPRLCTPADLLRR